MPSKYDSTKASPKSSKKLDYPGYKKGGKVFASSGAPIVKPTTARGSGAARRQLFRKNG